MLNLKSVSIYKNNLGSFEREGTKTKENFEFEI